MSNYARVSAIQDIAELPPVASSYDYKSERVESIYGINVFSIEKMEARLPKSIFKSLKAAINQGEKLPIEISDVVAASMKDWALERGATHYAHIFHPLTGATAEKHDSFYEPEGQAVTMASFAGKALVQGEPDGSSFPSGGIRATFEARGYTVWDVTSPAYIMEGVNGSTLCIPTAFVSWTGEALDKKTPLLRSMHAINKQAQRLLKLFGTENPGFVAATCGPEQEYFLIDTRLYHQRPDLYTCGRSLFGAKPARGQEFEDQYFGSVPDRVLAFMMEIEREGFKLGIPLKTRHNEVAPAQFELAPIFETANVAADHQQLTMTLLRKIAPKYGFQCLLHEKPFAGVNGSGKHVNWSIGCAATGNILEPGNEPHNNLRFQIFTAAVIRAVSLHQGLLRATVASAGNDHRLGANEAPPAIISVYLGSMLGEVFEQLAKTGTAASSKKGSNMQLGVSTLPEFLKDAGDRNRTSPFAFTGNKFEFRAVGSSFSVSGPLTALNTIVADSIEYISDALDKATKGAGIKDEKAFKAAAAKVLKDILAEHGSIIFNGNGYSTEWHVEAEKKRGLKNLRTSVDAFGEIAAKSTVEVFKKQGVLSKRELEAREEVAVHTYNLVVGTESKLTLEIGRTQLLPAATRHAVELSDAIGAVKGLKNSTLETVVKLTNELDSALVALEAAREKFTGTDDVHAAAKFGRDKVLPAALAVRKAADALEELVADDQWPLPSYQELLFLR
jgi:glutamine synthetase